MLIAVMARSTPLRTQALRLGEESGFSQDSVSPLKNPLSKEGVKHQSPTVRWVALGLAPALVGASETSSRKQEQLLGFVRNGASLFSFRLMGNCLERGFAGEGWAALKTMLLVHIVDGLFEAIKLR